MQISRQELEQLINEEIQTAIDEGWLDRMIAKGSGLKSRIGGALSGLGAKAARGLGADTAAGEMERTGKSRAADAPNQEKLGLMKQHARKFSIVSTDMIKDAKKLELLQDPNFKKALAAAKAVATRMNNIVAAWEKAPEQIPGGDDDQDSIPTQVVPKDDLDAEVAARQAAGSPEIREAIKRVIKEEIKRLTGEE